MSRPVDLIEQGDGQIGDRDARVALRVHDQLVAAQAVGARARADEQTRRRTQVGPVRALVRLADLVLRGAGPGNGARRPRQVALVVQYQTALPTGNVQRRGTTADKLALLPHEPIRAGWTKSTARNKMRLLIRDRWWVSKVDLITRFQFR